MPSSLGDGIQLDPVFVVGFPRSGTTLLYRSILSHPSFMHHRANFAESWAVEALYRFVEPDREPEQSLIAYLLGEDVPPEVRELTGRLASRRHFVRKLAGERRSLRVIPWRLAGEHLLLRSYFAAAARLRNGKRIVEKTPSHLNRVSLLKSAFPRSRFVCIIRHPIDVYSSHWRRASEDGDRAAWARISVDQMVAGWEGAVHAADKLAARFPDSFLVVRYEEFLSDTEAIVRRVLEHIGEEFDPICLLDREIPTSPDDQRPFLKPITRRTKTWQDFVSLEDARRVEERLRRPMERLGYEPLAGIRS